MNRAAIYAALLLFWEHLWAWGLPAMLGILAMVHDWQNFP